MSLIALIPLIGEVLDKVLPDANAAADAKLRMVELVQKGELAQLDAETKLAAGQLAVNQEEAKHSSIFVSGARPFIMWVCGAGCAWNWVGLPIAKVSLALAGITLSVTPADLSEMMPLLLGMLGLGSLRTVEKINGVASK